MKTICIIPCGKRKIWDKNHEAGPMKARDVYIGPFTRKCREYAEKFYPESWLILSAKYGFLLPEDTIPGSYDVSFNDKKTNPITIDTLEKQSIEMGLDNFDKIVVLCGKNYVEMAIEIFPSKEIEKPLDGCKGIGYMMGRLNEAIKNDVIL